MITVGGDRPYTADAVVRRERFILLDSSVEYGAGRSVFSDHLYSTRHWTDVSPETLQQGFRSGIFYEGLLDHPHVSVVDGVLQETQRYVDLLQQKIDWLNKMPLSERKKALKKVSSVLSRSSEGLSREERIALKNLLSDDTLAKLSKPARAGRRRSRPYDNPYKRVAAAKSWLPSLHWKYAEITAKMVNSIFKAENNVYNALEHLVITIAAETDAKINFRERYGNSGKAEDLNTDEQLVASALYRSLVHRAPTAIITGDSDIGRILQSTMWYFANPRLECAPVLESALRWRPIKIYYYTAPDEYKQSHNTKYWDRKHDTKQWMFVEGLQARISEQLLALTGSSRQTA